LRKSLGGNQSDRDITKRTYKIQLPFSDNGTAPEPQKLLNMTATTDTDDDHQPKQPHLAKQDAATVDPSKLTALTPEVVSTVKN
jgi:hypothetical protein